MAIRNQNWYNLQSTRRYPLDDLSSGLDDRGQFIRDDILVDCHIRFPNTLGRYLYVQGITVSAGIVTAVFGVTQNLNESGQTICAVSIPQPAAAYVNYPITALAAGVSGWVVFGPGIDNSFAGRYSTAQQTIIQPRNARPYMPLPIPTIGKLNLGTSLQGVVNIIATTPVTATHTSIEHAGETFPAIVFKLDESLITTDYNPLKSFLGPCGQRPESGTCPKQPIEMINGIVPDCNGNINISFDGFSSMNFEKCGGLNITTDTSLITICDANKPKPPQEFQDFCCEPTGENISTYPTRTDFPAAGELNKLYLAYDTNRVYRWSGSNYDDTDIVIDEYCWPDPTDNPDLIIDETLDAVDYPCLSLPLCLDFDACSPGENFVTQNGLFSSQQTSAPATCGNCNSHTFSPNLSTTLTNHQTYLSTGISGLNIALLKNCPTDWAIGRSIMAEFKIGTNGVARNGGIVLNYTQALTAGQIDTKYVVVSVDATRGKIRILRYTNDIFTEELAVNYAAKTNTWYRMYASLNRNSTRLTVSFSVSEISGALAASGSVNISGVSDLTGTIGLFANQSSTFFNKFLVQ